MYTIPRVTSGIKNAPVKRILHAHTKLLLKKREREKRKPKEKSKFAQILVFGANLTVLKPEGQRGRTLCLQLCSLRYTIKSSLHGASLFNSWLTLIEGQAYRRVLLPLLAKCHRMRRLTRVRAREYEREWNGNRNAHTCDSLTCGISLTSGVVSIEHCATGDAGNSVTRDTSLESRGCC